MDGERCTGPNTKKVGVAILISDKTDFKARTFIRDKEESYRMLKGPVLQEDSTVLNVHVLNSTASNIGRTAKTVRIVGRNEWTSITVGDFGTFPPPPSEMDRCSRQKVSKDRVNSIMSLIS